MKDEADLVKYTIGLSRTESALFDRLATNANGVVSRAELMSVLRGNAPHTLDSHVMSIRRKLTHHEVHRVSIETVKGAGFILKIGKRSHET